MLTISMIRALDMHFPVYDRKEEKYLNRYLRVAQENLAFETFELKNVIYKSV